MSVLSSAMDSVPVNDLRRAGGSPLTPPEQNRNISLGLTGAEELAHFLAEGFAGGEQARGQQQHSQHAERQLHHLMND